MAVSRDLLGRRLEAGEGLAHKAWGMGVLLPAVEVPKFFLGGGQGGVWGGWFGD